MVQGHPYWQNENMWQFIKKAVFLLPSKCEPRDAVQIPTLGYVAKWKEVLKCIKMKATLIIKGSLLHAIDVNEQTFQMPFLYNLAFRHQLQTSQRAFNSQVNRKLEQSEISAHSNSWETTITIIVINTRFLNFMIDPQYTTPCGMVILWPEYARMSEIT